MKAVIKKIGLVILSCIIVIYGRFDIYAWTQGDIAGKLQTTEKYVYQTVSAPQIGSIGGDWAVFGLARSEIEIPQSYYDQYYQNVAAYVKATKGQLHARKYTEYSRVIITLTAIGKDPRNVAGYNLLLPLGDYEKTVWQGINGPVWALLALDCGEYEMPQNKSAKKQATREMYIDKIISSQLADGGFSLTGTGKAEPDITGMVLAALAKYQDQPKVKTTIDKALNCLSKLQENDGGYAIYGIKNAESVVQVITGLTELGISLEDARFVKNGHTLVDNLMTYYTAEGGFKHSIGADKPDQMATEQGFYALSAIKRSLEAKNSLFRIKEHIEDKDVK